MSLKTRVKKLEEKMDTGCVVFCPVYHKELVDEEIRVVALTIRPTDPSTLIERKKDEGFGAFQKRAGQYAKELSGAQTFITMDEHVKAL